MSTFASRLKDQSPHPIDPVNLEPIPPLRDSYLYDSRPYQAPSDTEQIGEDDGWIMGIDEAGRGRPMVYAAAYCPLSFKPTLEGLGFDDSKALSADTRQALWESFDTNEPLCYSSYTLSPQGISAVMLRRTPINLNQQAQDATTSLIQSALDRRIPIRECYVDALGPSVPWQAKLSAMFPGIKFTVCPKADSLFKIVGAASIVAKVTRDRYIEHWRDPEDYWIEKKRRNSENGVVVKGEDEARESKRLKREDLASDNGRGKETTTEEGLEQQEETITRGSGYPSDPKTQAYLKEALDPLFGYRGIVRFSWATVKILMEKQGVECKWNDDIAQPSAAAYFASEAEGARPKLWRDLGVSAVGEL